MAKAKPLIGIFGEQDKERFETPPVFTTPGQIPTPQPQPEQEQSSLGLGRLMELATGGFGTQNRFAGIGGSGARLGTGGGMGGGVPEPPSPGQILGQAGVDVAQKVGTDFLKDKIFGGETGATLGTALGDIGATALAGGGYLLPSTAQPSLAAALGGYFSPEAGGFVVPSLGQFTGPATYTGYGPLAPTAGAAAAETSVFGTPLVGSGPTAGAGAGGIGALGTTLGLIGGLGGLAYGMTGGFGSDTRNANEAIEHAKDVALQGDVQNQKATGQYRVPGVGEIPATGELVGIARAQDIDIWKDFVNGVISIDEANVRALKVINTKALNRVPEQYAGARQLVEDQGLHDLLGKAASTVNLAPESDMWFNVMERLSSDPAQFKGFLTAMSKGDINTFKENLTRQERDSLGIT